MPQLRNVRQRALLQSAAGMKHNESVRITPNEVLTPNKLLRLKRSVLHASARLRRTESD